MKTYTLELTDEQVASLKKQGIIEEEEKERWYDPNKCEEDFHFLTHFGTGRTFDRNETSEKIFARQQVFHTKEEAEAADQWRIALTTILKWKALNTEEWEWTEGALNFYVKKDPEQLQTSFFTHTRVIPLPLYFKTEQDAQACLNACRKEWEILFNMNKE